MHNNKISNNEENFNNVDDVANLEQQPTYSANFIINNENLANFEATNLLKERICNDPRFFTWTLDDYKILWEKPKPGGFLKCKLATAEYLNKFHLNSTIPIISSTSLILTPGGDVAFDMLALTLFQRQDSILCGISSPEQICRILKKYAHLKIHHVKLEISHFKTIFEKVKAEGENVRAILLTIPANKISKNSLTPKFDEILEICKWALRKNLYLIIDESLGSYDILYQNKSILSSINQLSKNWQQKFLWVYNADEDFDMPGLKFGAIYTENNYLQKVLSQMENLHPCAPLVQSFVIRLFGDIDWLEKWHAAKIRRNELLDSDFKIDIPKVNINEFSQQNSMLASTAFDFNCTNEDKPSEAMLLKVCQLQGVEENQLILYEELDWTPINPSTRKYSQEKHYLPPSKNKRRSSFSGFDNEEFSPKKMNEAKIFEDNKNQAKNDENSSNNILKHVFPNSKNSDDDYSMYGVEKFHHQNIDSKRSIQSLQSPGNFSKSSNKLVEASNFNENLDSDKISIEALNVLDNIFKKKSENLSINPSNNVSEAKNNKVAEVNLSYQADVKSLPLNKEVVNEKTDSYNYPEDFSHSTRKAAETEAHTAYKKAEFEKRRSNFPKTIVSKTEPAKNQEKVALNFIKDFETSLIFDKVFEEFEHKRKNIDSTTKSLKNSSNFPSTFNEEKNEIQLTDSANNEDSAYKEDSNKNKRPANNDSTNNDDFTQYGSPTVTNEAQKKHENFIENSILLDSLEDVVESLEKDESKLEEENQKNYNQKELFNLPENPTLELISPQKGKELEERRNLLAGKIRWANEQAHHQKYLSTISEHESEPSHHEIMLTDSDNEDEMDIIKSDIYKSNANRLDKIETKKLNDEEKISSEVETNKNSVPEELAWILNIINKKSNIESQQLNKDSEDLESSNFTEANNSKNEHKESTNNKIKSSEKSSKLNKTIEYDEETDKIDNLKDKPHKNFKSFNSNSTNLRNTAYNTSNENIEEKSDNAWILDIINNKSESKEKSNFKNSIENEENFNKLENKKTKEKIKNSEAPKNEENLKSSLYEDNRKKILRNPNEDQNWILEIMNKKSLTIPKNEENLSKNQDTEIVALSKVQELESDEKNNMVDETKIKDVLKSISNNLASDPQDKKMTSKSIQEEMNSKIEESEDSSEESNKDWILSLVTNKKYTPNICEENEVNKIQKNEFTKNLNATEPLNIQIDNPSKSIKRRKDKALKTIKPQYSPNYSWISNIVQQSNFEENKDNKRDSGIELKNSANSTMERNKNDEVRETKTFVKNRPNPLTFKTSNYAYYNEESSMNEAQKPVNTRQYLYADSKDKQADSSEIKITTDNVLDVVFKVFPKCQSETQNFYTNTANKIPIKYSNNIQKNKNAESEPATTIVVLDSELENEKQINGYIDRLFLEIDNEPSRIIKTNFDSSTPLSIIEPSSHQRRNICSRPDSGLNVSGDSSPNFDDLDAGIHLGSRSTNVYDIPEESSPLPIGEDPMLTQQQTIVQHFEGCFDYDESNASKANFLKDSGVFFEPNSGSLTIEFPLLIPKIKDSSATAPKNAYNTLRDFFDTNYSEEDVFKSADDMMLSSKDSAKYSTTPDMFQMSPDYHRSNIMESMKNSVKESKNGSNKVVFEEAELISLINKPLNEVKHNVTNEVNPSKTSHEALTAESNPSKTYHKDLTDKANLSKIYNEALTAESNSSTRSPDDLKNEFKIYYYRNNIIESIKNSVKESKTDSNKVVFEKAELISLINKPLNQVENNVTNENEVNSSKTSHEALTAESNSSEIYHKDLTDKVNLSKIYNEALIAESNSSTRSHDDLKNEENILSKISIEEIKSEEKTRRSFKISTNELFNNLTYDDKNEQQNPKDQLKWAPVKYTNFNKKIEASNLSKNSNNNLNEKTITRLQSNDEKNMNFDKTSNNDVNVFEEVEAPLEKSFNISFKNAPIIPNNSTIEKPNSTTIITTTQFPFNENDIKRIEELKWEPIPDLEDFELNIMKEKVSTKLKEEIFENILGNEVDQKSKEELKWASIKYLDFDSYKLKESKLSPLEESSKKDLNEQIEAKETQSEFPFDEADFKKSEAELKWEPIEDLDLDSNSYKEDEFTRYLVTDRPNIKKFNSSRQKTINNEQEDEEEANENRKPTIESILHFEIGVWDPVEDISKFEIQLNLLPDRPHLQQQLSESELLAMLSEGSKFCPASKPAASVVKQVVVMDNLKPIVELGDTTNRDIEISESGSSITSTVPKWEPLENLIVDESYQLKNSDELREKNSFIETKKFSVEPQTIDKNVNNEVASSSIDYSIEKLQNEILAEYVCFVSRESDYHPKICVKETVRQKRAQETLKKQSTIDIPEHFYYESLEDNKKILEDIEKYILSKPKKDIKYLETFEYPTNIENIEELSEEVSKLQEYAKLSEGTIPFANLKGILINFLKKFEDLKAHPLYKLSDDSKKNTFDVFTKDKAKALIVEIKKEAKEEETDSEANKQRNSKFEKSESGILFIEEGEEKEANKQKKLEADLSASKNLPSKRISGNLEEVLNKMEDVLTDLRAVSGAQKFDDNNFINNETANFIAERPGIQSETNYFAIAPTQIHHKLQMLRHKRKTRGDQQKNHLILQHVNITEISYYGDRFTKSNGEEYLLKDSVVINSFTPTELFHNGIKIHNGNHEEPLLKKKWIKEEAWDKKTVSKTKSLKKEEEEEEEEKDEIEKKPNNGEKVNFKTTTKFESAEQPLEICCRFRILNQQNPNNSPPLNLSQTTINEDSRQQQPQQQQINKLYAIRHSTMPSKGPPALESIDKLSAKPKNYARKAHKASKRRTYNGGGSEPNKITLITKFNPKTNASSNTITVRHTPGSKWLVSSVCKSTQFGFEKSTFRTNVPTDTTK